MSRFTDLYLKKNQNRDVDIAKQIAADPFTAIMKGVSKQEVVSALRKEGWSEGEIAKFNDMVDELKSKMS